MGCAIRFRLAALPKRQRRRTAACSFASNTPGRPSVYRLEKTYDKPCVHLTVCRWAWTAPWSHLRRPWRAPSWREPPTPACEGCFFLLFCPFLLSPSAVGVALLAFLPLHAMIAAMTCLSTLFSAPCSKLYHDELVGRAKEEAHRAEKKASAGGRQRC